MTVNDDAVTGFISVRELAAILYRRRYWLIVPTLLGLVAALAAVLLMTPTYRSSATLLITSQQIPTTVVASPLSNFADERIGKIRQQIMSRENLSGLIQRYNLYAEERAQLPLDAVIAAMRGSIQVDLVGTSTPGRSGQGGTIAFDLGFNYRDPVVAQAVTETLTAMFMDEDKRLRTEQASGTAAFLGRRAKELRVQLVELAGKRREVEARYAGALPEQVAISAQSGAALRAEVSRIDAETQGLMQQNSLLAARGQEIAATPRVGNDELRRAEERLNQLSAVYADNFPDVVAARDAVARQRETLQRNAARAAPAPGGNIIGAEVAAGRSRIGALAGRRAALVQSVAQMERMTALAPQASYELNLLQRDYENLRLQYQGIREKQMEAQVAANLQTEDKGERFTIVDAPSLPTAPLGPSRMAMVAGGTIGGLALALAIVIAWELLAGPIHGAGGVTRFTGAPPLVVVPVLRSGSAFDWKLWMGSLLRWPSRHGAMWGRT